MPVKKVIYEITGGCTLCGTCVFECPIGAIKLTGKGATINPDKCIQCGKCYENCASEAVNRIDTTKKGEPAYD